MEAYKRFNAPIPKELVPPKLTALSSPYWRAYCELSSERKEASLPIPWSSIISYARWHKMDEQQLVDIIRVVDSERNTKQTREEVRNG